MTRLSHHILTASLALVLAAVPQAVAAQEVVQPLPGTTDADRLADTMRQLASNPRNVDALVRAGELSLGLGDLSGAAALFARAEKVDPRNGRMKAGMASILVRSERPGQALRYFAQAEAFGLQPRFFASDRGLAYDLIGEQDRAQRDYRVALRDASDDETIRRYALSLGISGKRDLALKQLDPLVLKKDRGAWRARAFILAMSNDQRGAETIVTTMMPGAAAQGLQPFFQRLPTLSPADRAFAVHFGEVHTTPQRIADARLTPALPVMGVDPTAPVMLAQVQPQVVPQATASANAGRREKSRDRRERRASPGRVEMAAAVPVPVPVPATVAPTAAAGVSATGSAAGTRVASTAGVASPAPSTPAASTPVGGATQLASVQPLPRATAPVTTPTQSSSVVASASPSSSPARVFVQPLPVRPPVALATARPSTTVSTPTPSGTLPETLTAQMAALPASSAGTPIVSRAGATVVAAEPVASTPAQVAAASTPTPTPTQIATTSPTPGFTSAAPVELAANTTRMPTRAVTASEDSILARIVASLSIPASELDVAPLARSSAAQPAAAAGAAPVPDDGARVVAEAQAKAARDALADRAAADALAVTKAAEAKAARAKLAADKKAADRKAVADKKLLAEKKEAAEKKAIADKAAAEEKRIARANPERIWVQVSTGATEGDLPKAWKGVKAKAPAVVGTRGGWTTPWRATNRVLAGPFKTAAEARTFVNALAKEGVSTFSFTSDAGQVITKLPAK
ncbi:MULTISPECIES: SPOR domain-containing protein [unclassified Sphingomonas]|uniref:SPOR domain-containing protein n=1 Tax=Sphingomonas sp. PvP015 TaxID=3156388 RepID=UPI003397A3E8